LAYGKDIKLEYPSITSLAAGLDSLPDLSLARFERLTIFTTGPYNGHSNQHTATNFSKYGFRT
jgi:hypothetical protein